MGLPARGRRQNAISGDLEAVLDDAADGAGGDGVAEVGGAVEAEGAVEGGAVEAEELVAVGDAARVLLWELGGFSFNGVAVFLEPRDRPLGVVDFEDSVDFADRGLLLQPA